MKPNDVIAYLERKAVENPSIAHSPAEGKCNFHVIDDPYDFDEFNNAIRNSATFPAMLMEQSDGQVSGNASANYTNTLRTSFMILDRRRDSDKIRDVRNRCYDIGFEILTQIRKDQPNNIIVQKRVNMVINSSYIPIGPIEGQYYGYQFEMEFTASIKF